MSIYYDPVSGRKLRITSIENVLRGANIPVTKINFDKIPRKIIKRIAFKSNGCTCQNMMCGCCIGMNLGPNFHREGKILFFLSISLLHIFYR